MSEAVNKDLTSRLKVSPDLFKLAVDNAFDHIIITDLNGVIIYANKAVEKITGYRLNEIIGNSPSLWGRMMPAEFYKNLWQTIKVKKKPFVGEITNRRKNGEQYIAELRISPILDDADQVIMFIGIERDVTKQKRIDQMKTDFVSFASHELRNPLTVIGLNAEYLIANNVGLATSQLRSIYTIYKEDRQMVELVSSLLDINKIELGEWDAEKKATNISGLIDSFLHDEEIIIKKKKITIKKNFSKNIKIMSDPKMVRLLFDNLISNAVKYSRPGGQVEISIKGKRKELYCTVADQGYGIPKAQQKLIFSRLFRANNVRKEGIGGSGLGLYLCKTVVDRLGVKYRLNRERIRAQLSL